MNIVAYTAITGGRDSLRPDQASEGAAWYAFLDQPDSIGPWQPLIACELFGDQNRNAKIHKILPHQYFPDADYSLWLDGNLALRVSVPVLVDRFLRETDIAMFAHPERDCLYAEGTASMEQARYPAWEVFGQLERYWRAGLASHAGLFECGVILRRHTPATERFNEAWWSEICRHSVQDQLSVLMAARKTCIAVTRIPGSIRHGNEFVHWVPHQGVSPLQAIAFSDLVDSAQGREGAELTLHLKLGRTTKGTVFIHKAKVVCKGCAHMGLCGNWLSRRVTGECFEWMCSVTAPDLVRELAQACVWRAHTCPGSQTCGNVQLDIEAIVDMFITARNKILQHA
jgi:Protein of unknown function (DUF616)